MTRCTAGLLEKDPALSGDLRMDASVRFSLNSKLSVALLQFITAVADSCVLDTLLASWSRALVWLALPFLVAQQDPEVRDLTRTSLVALCRRCPGKTRTLLGCLLSGNAQLWACLASDPALLEALRPTSRGADKGYMLCAPYADSMFLAYCADEVLRASVADVLNALDSDCNWGPLLPRWGEAH
jgi:hypothetical protein